MHSVVGLKDIFIIPKGMAGSFIAGNSIEGTIGLALRTGASLTISPINTVKDYKDRESPGKINFAIEGTSQMNNFDYLYYCKNLAFANGCDIVVLTEGYSVDGSGNITSPNGIFVFTGEDYMGFDFTFSRTEKERTIKVNAEVALSEDRANLRLQSAPTQIIKLNIAYQKGFNRPDYVVKPDFISAKAYGLNGGATMDDLFLADELLDAKYEFKTAGTKTANNRTRVNKVQVTIELTTSEANCTKMTKYLNLPYNAAIILTDRISLAEIEQYVIESGALYNSKTYLIGDTDRNTKISLSGSLYSSEFLIATIPDNTITMKAF